MDHIWNLKWIDIGYCPENWLIVEPPLELWTSRSFNVSSPTILQQDHSGSKIVKLKKESAQKRLQEARIPLSPRANWKTATAISRDYFKAVTCLISCSQHFWWFLKNILVLLTKFMKWNCWNIMKFKFTTKVYESQNFRARLHTTPKSKFSNLCPGNFLNKSGVGLNLTQSFHHLDYITWLCKMPTLCIRTFI